MFSSLVLSHWLPGSTSGATEGGVVVWVDPALSVNRSVSLLRVDNAAEVLSLSTSRAHELGFTDGERAHSAEVAARLEGAGISLNDPDHLFYLTLPDQAALRDTPANSATRQLTTGDAALFEEFTSEAPADEVDEAFVELDHWLVFGTFVGDKLACVASMYPWDGTQLADLGVITLPAFRGRGLGSETVRAISAEALRRGYEPQYRCQIDNTASVALAQSAGFTHFGEWEVVVTEE